MAKWKTWAIGLLAAFIGGFAGIVESVLILPAVAPDAFNLHEHFEKTLGVAAALGTLQGIKFAMAYLAKSPVPREVWTEEERAAQLDK